MRYTARLGNMNSHLAVIGRFAPSPTGALHAGSLVAALGSCLSARSRAGRWLLRMEDLDTPRCSPAAEATILRQLERLGFTWDGPVIRQSERLDAYHDALQMLRNGGWTYACTCSRRERAQDGTDSCCGGCSERALAPSGRHSVRVRVDDRPITFADRYCGMQQQVPRQCGGDFVILRADGYFAYQLAVVVDDAASGITEVVRGADLLDSTGRQIHLQRLLGLPPVRYGHLPLVYNTLGQKLSKQTRAAPVGEHDPLTDLQQAMVALGQTIEPVGSVEAFWRRAVEIWDESRIPSSPV